MRRLVVVAAAALALLGGCQYPRDVDGTLDRVRGGGTLRVGVSQTAPWVVLPGGDPRRARGVEPAVLRAFARSLRAQIAFEQDSEAELVHRLREGELDIVAAGLTQDTPWKREAALTRQYLRTDDGGGSRKAHAHVLAVKMGENALQVELERFLRRSGSALARHELARSPEAN